MEKQLFVITLNVGSSFASETGSWRTGRPVYASPLSPCNKTYPAGENIQQWLYHVEEGDYQAAWCEIMINNPMPATMGRVCYHSCQSAYNCVQVDEAVGINVIERFLGDGAIERRWRVPVLAPDLGKSVLTVGAGPFGLSTTYYLHLVGHRVHIKEAGLMAGGMMRSGISLYRLPRGILDVKIRRIKEVDVFIEYSAKVESVEGELDRWDAIFFTVDAHISYHTDIPTSKSAKIVDAVSLLQGVEKGGSPILGREVVVYGGGNTVIDVVRTAKCLGALEAIIVYRRIRDHMPAHDSEIAEAKEEGTMVRWLSAVKHVDGGILTIERMELDDSGFPQPTGGFEELGTDSLVMAPGQEMDLSLIGDISGIETEDGVAKVSGQMMTGIEGVFAGSDMVPLERMVTVAIGYGKKASRYIDAYLYGTIYTLASKYADVEFSCVAPWYYTDAPRQVRAKLGDARRTSIFDEVVQGLDEESALFEARCCISCGNCFGCDNCFGVCPDNVIVRTTPDEYELKYDYCKDCGLCVEECPCGAISVVPEQVWRWNDPRGVAGWREAAPPHSAPVLRTVASRRCCHSATRRSD